MTKGSTEIVGVSAVVVVVLVVVEVLVVGNMFWIDARDKIEVLVCPFDGLFDLGDELLGLGDELLLLEDFDFFEGDDAVANVAASDVILGEGIAVLLESNDFCESTAEDFEASLCWCCCCCLPLKS